ncbi:hypothetical protein FAM09_18300 [Niastella caeni]|uniref:Phage late control D family protein n=1 Tax=Niastella caeni TaxID=2569763 RepID=A0A4S8HNT7_9BACT|nr:hypothetical protein [Niastella caeni]THU36915.1 hypothetical protein FAM09_18300 [Niastella caeni]
MFTLTSEIKIEGIKNIIKPTAIKWKRSVTDYCDTATITLPAIAMLISNGEENYKRVETGLQFREGMKVLIKCGYDKDNSVRFQGFIRRINPKVPLELECEGYTYQLRKKQNINKSYKAGKKLRAILEDLVEGTDITLSRLIPDVTIESSLTFEKKKATEVLDWLKEKLLLTVYFNLNELYVGLREAELKKNITLRLGWNVAESNELKFNNNRELAQVRISLAQKAKNGKTETATPVDPKDKNVKQIRLPVRIDKASLKKIEEEQRKKMLNRGYEGAVTAFLIPYAEPGMAVIIEDNKYPQRTGKYFIESVEGEYGSGGGRQKINISSTL